MSWTAHGSFDMLLATSTSEGFKETPKVYPDAKHHRSSEITNFWLRLTKWSTCILQFQDKWIKFCALSWSRGGETTLINQSINLIKASDAARFTVAWSSRRQISRTPKKFPFNCTQISMTRIFQYGIIHKLLLQNYL